MKYVHLTRGRKSIPCLIRRAAAAVREAEEKNPELAPRFADNLASMKLSIAPPPGPGDDEHHFADPLRRVAHKPRVWRYEEGKAQLGHGEEGQDDDNHAVRRCR